MPNDNAHFVAILVAVALPVAVWIGSDYLAQVPAQPEQVTNDGPAPVSASEAPKSSIPASGSELPPPAVRPERVMEDAVVSRHPSSSVIHKCRVQGRIVYSDLPCNAGTGVKSFTPDSAVTAPDETRRTLEPPRPTLPPTRAAPPTEQVAAADTVDRETAARQGECRRIDERIALIDAQLRQPHSAQEGDWLNDQRKKLTDERFSLKC